MSIVLPSESVGATRWHAVFLVALTVAVAGRGAPNEGQTRQIEDPDEQLQEFAEGAPVSIPVPATGHLGRVVRDHQGDGGVLGKV